MPNSMDGLCNSFHADVENEAAVVDSQESTNESLVDVDGYCVVCQEAHKMTDSCLRDVQCKNCFKKGHLRIDCPKNSLSKEELENTTRCGIKRKVQVVEDNIGIKIGREVLSNSSSHPKILKIDPESNDSVKVEHQISDSIKQEYYEDHIVMKKEAEYIEKTTLNSVKSESKVDHPTSSDVNSLKTIPVIEKYQPPVPVKRTPTNAKFWELKKQKLLCVLCPVNCKNTLVNISNIARHIQKVHPHFKAEIFCRFCQEIVVPKDVSNHMPKCSSSTPLGKSWLAAEKWRTIQRASQDFQFWQLPLLPGLSTVPDNSADLSFFSAKLFLESYLVTNFMVSKGDSLNCSWMFTNYMETNKVKGREEVLSSTRFLQVVKELSAKKWGKDVGRPFMSVGNPYFAGLKLKG